MSESAPSVPPPAPRPPALPPRLEPAPAASAGTPVTFPANPPPFPPLTPPGRRKRRGCLITFAVAAVLLAGLLLILGAAAFYFLAGGKHWFVGSRPERLREDFVCGNFLAREKIAVIDVKGLILQSTFYDGASSGLICAALQEAADDDSVKAVILDVDSPGGEITASDEIHHAVIQFREDTDKPVVTCMHALGASGAYYVAAASDHIIANRLTLTGSIGVIIPHYVYKDLLDKIGIRSEPYKSGTMKDMLNGARDPVPEKEKAFIQDMVLLPLTEDITFRDKIPGIGKTAQEITALRGIIPVKDRGRNIINIFIRGITEKKYLNKRGDKNNRFHPGIAEDLLEFFY